MSAIRYCYIIKDTKGENRWKIIFIVSIAENIFLMKSFVRIAAATNGCRKETKMADIKWIKLSTDLFDNRKIKQIRKLPEGDAIIGVWLQILCLAGSVNNGGLVYFSKDVPYTNEMLSNEFDRPLNIIRLAMETFTYFNMIEIIEDVVCVSNWEKYQSLDGLDKIREQNKLRKQQQRERQKLLSCDGHVTVTQSSISNSISISNKFNIPSIEDIKQYCIERKNKVDAETFFDFYESKGWLIGKNKMKDWKAAVRTWEKNEKEKPKTPERIEVKRKII